jgi:hypothetical protein
MAVVNRKFWPILWCGLHGLQKPNASAQPLPKAEAQRTLEAVGCSALFGSDGVALRALQQFFDPDTRHRDGVLCLQAAGDPGRVFLVVRVPQHPVNSR